MPTAGAPPYARFMFGGRKVTREILDREWRQKLWEEWNDGSGILGQYPKRSDYSVETAENSPSIAVGGGFDWVVTRPFACRLVKVEYTHSWTNDIGTIKPQRGLKILLVDL